MAKEIPLASVHACSSNPAAISRDTAEHYRWGVDCDAWYLVNDEQLSVIEEFMPPGAAEIRPHRKRSSFSFSGGDHGSGRQTSPCGTGIRVLPGKRHQIRNPSSSPVSW
jgi:hypothetical protein